MVTVVPGVVELATVEEPKELSFTFNLKSIYTSELGWARSNSRRPCEQLLSCGANNGRRALNLLNAIFTILILYR